MPQGADGCEVRGRKGPEGIDLSFTLEELENLPDTKCGTREHHWTAQEDGILLNYWNRKDKRAVARAIGVCEGTARARYKELTREG